MKKFLFFSVFLMFAAFAARSDDALVRNARFPIDREVVQATVQAAESPSEDPLREAPYGIIVSENRGDDVIADFLTTREVPEGVMFGKRFDFPDGTSLVLPGWRMSRPTGGEIYRFPLWDGNLSVLWGGEGDVKISVISLNPESGYYSVVSDRLKVWSGRSTRKLPQLKYAMAENGVVKVGLISDGAPPEFFLDGRRIPLGAIAETDGEEFLLSPSIETPFYEGERVLSVRTGGQCDTIHFRYFR